MALRRTRTRVGMPVLAGLLALTALAAPAIPVQATARQVPGVRAGAAARWPGIDPAYLYAQLAYLATHFQHREAGYRAGSAGHVGFARYWTRQMLGVLGPFGARARSLPFAVRGWLGRPATAPAVNVEVTVPGLADPQREVIIGCHYDGEADSTESANDDASGCAIELGVASAMAAYWRAHHLGPAATLRFVLFDAEEQGIFGSFDYVNSIARGDLPYMSAMINEEQNGIAYPLRYLGRAQNPLMPLFAYVAPAQANGIYPNRVTTPRQRIALGQFRLLVRRAVPAAFRQFRAMGDQMLTYHRNSGPDAWQPIFTPAHISKVRVLADAIGSSDQVPFTEAGIRAVTFVGNATYYLRSPPPGSYPYDQPQDTVALMNTFADGGAAPSHALALALALPGMLTTWLLSQPSVLGLARPGRRPAAAIGDIGVVVPGHPASFSAAAAYVPGQPGARLHFSWSFGDGRSASGRQVRHVYRAPGSYRLRLTVSSARSRPLVITRQVRVGSQAAFANPYARMPPGGPGSIGYQVAHGLPPANRAAVLPAPAPGRRDRVGTVAQARRAAAATGGSGRRATGRALPWALAAAGVVLLAGLVLAAVWRVRKRNRTASPG